MYSIVARRTQNHSRTPLIRFLPPDSSSAMLLQGGFRVLLLLTAVCTSVLASPLVSHEKRSHTPFGWSLLRRHDSSATMPLRFGLKQSNIDKIDEYLYDVSHPSSANYGKHWTAAEIAATFAPDDSTIDTVRSWLVESGIAVEKIRLTASKGWIEADVTVGEAENLMNTEYNVYTHETGKEHIGIVSYSTRLLVNIKLMFLACNEYHLPLHVAPHVELVTPSVHFDAIIQKRSPTQPAKAVGKPGSGNGPKLGAAAVAPKINSNLTDCDEQITLDCLRALYNISHTPVSGDVNTFGIGVPSSFLNRVDC